MENGNEETDSRDKPEQAWTPVGRREHQMSEGTPPNPLASWVVAATVEPLERAAELRGSPTMVPWAPTPHPKSKYANQDAYTA